MREQRRTQCYVIGRSARKFEPVPHLCLFNDLFPKILLNGSAGRQATEPAGLTLGAGNFFAIGPAITLPIFTGGKIRANIEAQKPRLDQALTQYRSAVLRSLEKTEKSLVGYRREKDRQTRLRPAVQASREPPILPAELYSHR